MFQRMALKNVTNLDITINPDDLIGGVKLVLSRLKPDWDLETIKYKVRDSVLPTLLHSSLK